MKSEDREKRADTTTPRHKEASGRTESRRPMAWYPLTTKQITSNGREWIQDQERPESTLEEKAGPKTKEKHLPTAGSLPVIDITFTQLTQEGLFLMKCCTSNLILRITNWVHDWRLLFVWQEVAAAL